MTRRTTPEERFWARVDKSAGPEGCWLWTSTRMPKGYGVVGIAGLNVGTRLAHRISYELTFDPVSSDLFVCHHCDNPPCVNPAHLFLGTQTDNMRDLSNKGLHPNQLRTACIHGHEYTPENTLHERSRTGQTRRCRTCRIKQGKARAA